MPSIAQTPPGRIGSKRRRRDDDEGVPRAGYVALFPTDYEWKADVGEMCSVQMHFPRQNDELSMEMSMGKEKHWRPIAGKPLRQPSKRARVSSLYHDTTPDGTSHSSPYEGIRHGHGASTGSGTEEAVKEKKIDLRPCHICRRRPSDRAQLDRYADCEGCGARTCFVCMRQCEGDFAGFRDGLELDVEGDFDCLASSFERRGSGTGASDGVDIGGGDCFRNREREGNNDGKGIWEKERVMGHRRKVCRECCVELGAEGEVRCLGCYRVGEP